MAIHRRTGKNAEGLSLPRFTRAGMLQVPKNRIPDLPMLAQTAYQVVMDEVMLDGNARFNLATFVTTWMDEEADSTGTPRPTGASRSWWTPPATEPTPSGTAGPSSSPACCRPASRPPAQ